MEDNPALEILGVSHAFAKAVALRDVELVVPRGKFVALLGVNGAGKTTLFSLITRLYDNTSGVIRVVGHDLRRNPSKALARLGVVFQTRALDSDLTITQNLAYHAALHGIDRATARGRIREVLAQVDLVDKAGMKVASLSGGQQRRAEIARALINRPDLLLLDEATTGLDVRSRREVLALVRGLTADGVSVLWATHILDEIAPEDEVYILHQGAILARGIARELAGTEGLTRAFLTLTGAEA
ncbi:MAG: ATP-binding cassette domain-containing protein [Proteobacteria bacterium]|nr:MAG: ATP-binding cassette domain-containing protein [Pseudomonadota bacterium]